MRVLVAGAVVACLLSAATDVPAAGADRSDSGCRVGGQPSLPQEPNEGEGEIRGGPVVVGCGRSGGEPLEIVAYSTTKYLCFHVDRPAEPREGGSQDLGCKQNRSRWVEYCSPDPCVVSFAAGPIEGWKLTRTIVGGAALAPAAQVEVWARADGHRRSFPVVEAHVDSPGLLALLHQPRPIFLFAALLPRCYPPAVRVTSFDAKGIALATGRGQLFFANPCRLTFRG